MEKGKGQFQDDGCVMELALGKGWLGRNDEENSRKKSGVDSIRYLLIGGRISFVRNMACLKANSKSE